MHAVAACARLVLAGVFALAAAAKFADVRGSRAAVRGFSVPERFASPLGTLLPFVAVTVAGATDAQRDPMPSDIAG